MVFSLWTVQSSLNVNLPYRSAKHGRFNRSAMPGRSVKSSTISTYLGSIPPCWKNRQSINKDYLYSAYSTILRNWRNCQYYILTYNDNATCTYIMYTYMHTHCTCRMTCTAITNLFQPRSRVSLHLLPSSPGSQPGKSHSSHALEHSNTKSTTPQEDSAIGWSN